jgi:hypothetical protein
MYFKEKFITTMYFTFCEWKTGVTSISGYKENHVMKAVECLINFTKLLSKEKCLRLVNK